MLWLNNSLCIDIISVLKVTIDDDIQDSRNNIRLQYSILYVYKLGKNIKQ